MTPNLERPQGIYYLEREGRRRERERVRLG